MHQPSITFFGILIQEPVTMLTDLLISLVCFISFYRLSKEKNKETHFFYYRWFILTMGFATLYGGIIGHGFLYLFGFKAKIPGWFIGMLSVGFAERGAILHARKLLHVTWGNFLSVANIAEVLIMMFIAAYTLNFFFVELHATYGMMLVVFSFELFIYIRVKRPGSLWMIGGISISALSAIVHMTKFTVDIWFNYNDLSHVLMALAFVVFHRGMTQLYKDHEPVPSF